MLIERGKQKDSKKRKEKAKLIGLLMHLDLLTHLERQMHYPQAWHIQGSHDLDMFVQKY
jgi:hypothetical protein